MKVLKPSKNSQTGNPKSHGYNAYDFSGNGDQNVYSALFGKVTQAKNSETRNWLVGQSTDPYIKTRGKKNGSYNLLTEDYGNYCKIKHEVDGQVFYTLYAHLDVGSVIPVGTEVTQGQVIAKIDHTGNSTAKHLHFECRDGNNKNIEVEFIDNIETPKPIEMDKTKEQIIIDSYKATTGEYPSDDEKKARLQKNENTVELIEDLLTGDARAKERWLKVWNSENNDIVLQEMIEQYKTTLGTLKEILKVPYGADNETLIGKARGVLNDLTVAQEASTPKTIYKSENKDYTKLISFGNITIIIEK